MKRLTSEFFVGLFVIGILLLIAFGYYMTKDGVAVGEGTYRLYVVVDSADGLWKGSRVSVAGVEAGQVSDIEWMGDRARLTLDVREEFKLPLGTGVEIKQSGMLGDKYVALFPGDEDGLVGDGATLEVSAEPGDLDEITRQVEGITDDVKAITAALRELAENRDNSDALEATLANTEALSAELRLMAEQNRRDIADIVDSVKRMTENLEAMSADARGDVNEELDKIQELTDGLNRTVDDLESITSKIDEGQGTLGALVNDRETVDALNDTIDNANDVIESFSGLRTKVYYTGRWYMGSQPNDPAAFAPFDGRNPLANTGSNTIGIELRSQEDFWYTFEVVDYPTGVVNYTERYVPELDQYYTEWVRTPSYRITFQMNKRWGDFSFRLGIKEYGGGVGVTWYGLDDRLTLSADAFDFDLGSYPAVEASGTPNIRLAARYEPIQHVYFEVGNEQTILGARYGYYTMFGGAGFHFNDDDIKLLFATLPLGF